MTSSLNINHHLISSLLTCKLTATKSNTDQQVLSYFVKRIIGTNNKTPVYWLPLAMISERFSTFPLVATTQYLNFIVVLTHVFSTYPNNKAREACRMISVFLRTGTTCKKIRLFNRGSARVVWFWSQKLIQP